MLPFTRRETEQATTTAPEITKILDGKRPSHDDVRNLSQVADLPVFRSVLKLAALATGKIINESALARDAKAAATTVARYMSILETSYIAHRIQPFLNNRATRIVKSPKLYITDSGLACHLAGAGSGDLDARDPITGAIFETYFYQNVAGILAARAPDAEITYWNVQGRHEVDFVITRRRKSIAIELKAASQFDERDLSGLRALRAVAPNISMFILAFNGKRTIPIDDKTLAVPVGLLLR